VRRRRRTATAVAVVALLVVAVVGVGVLAVPLADNAENSARLAQGYDVDRSVLDDAPEGPDDQPVVVFLPPIYGDWLNHPFQAYRNDPGFDDHVVYALDHGGGNFDVTDAYPDRSYYRYTYQGRWAPAAGGTVEPRLQPVSITEGETVGVNVSLGRPEWVVRGAIELTTDEGSVAYYVENSPPSDGARGGEDTIDARLVVSDGRVRLVGSDVTPQSGNGSVRVASTDSIRLVATLDSQSSAGLTYRLETPVQPGLGPEPSAVMTPTIEACVGYADCQGGAAYLPNASPPGVDVTVSVWSTDGTDRNRTASTPPHRTQPRDGAGHSTGAPGSLTPTQYPSTVVTRVRPA
jgi:hypothetical protein